MLGKRPNLKTATPLPRFLLVVEPEPDGAAAEERKAWAEHQLEVAEQHDNKVAAN